MKSLHKVKYMFLRYAEHWAKVFSMKTLPINKGKNDIKENGFKIHYQNSNKNYPHMLTKSIWGKIMF